MRDSSLHLRAATYAVLAAVVACEDRPPPSDGAPTPAAVEQLVRELDDRFNARDVDGFFGVFSPLHKHRHSSLEARYREIIEPGTIRSTSVVTDYRVEGDRGIALVEALCTTPDDPRAPAVKRAYSLVTSKFNGEPRVLFMTEVDDQALTHMRRATADDGTFVCQACNYRIAKVDDWLMVPVLQWQSGCMESVAFYSLRHDASISLSVHIDDELGSAGDLRDVLARLVGESASRVEAWRPPAHGDDEFAELTGVRCRVTRNGVAVELYLAEYAGFYYLLEAIGPDLEAAHDDIRAILANFRLLSEEATPGEARQRALDGHRRGALENGTFHHSGTALAVDCPKDWTGKVLVDTHAFHVRFDCPERKARIHVKAVEPPTGTDRWTRDAADFMIRQTFPPDRGDAEIGDWEPTASTELQLDPAVWSSHRRVSVTPADGPRHRIDFFLSDEVLLIFRGTIPTEDPAASAAETALETALLSLRPM